MEQTDRELRPLRQLRVDLEEGISQKSLIEDDESERYVLIPHSHASAGYHDMEQFIDSVRDALFRELLEVAIQGRGAFRRFKDAVGRQPDELQRWFEFRNRRLVERARDWLADAGWEPAPPDLPR